MIEIEIDGQKIKTDEGASIIEAADEAGIYIPRFCYHKKLSVAANCRMCLVEVDKVGKPLPACATPVTPDMKVFTKSKKAVDAQRSVMEYLLINHPLDCPICDQGGECELQDLSMGYGAAHSEYDESKRAVFSEDIGPLIETEMTRCIHCTRCVRFGDEVAGLRELGVVNRGEHSEIGTYVKHMLKSEVSGNVIDLCPVGALTAKPSRYTGRGYEMTEHPMIAPHDCVGTNTYIHTKGREYAHQRLVMRVVPRENERINETWMSDRDRFSYEGLSHSDRCLQPLLKKNNDWVTASWQEALDILVKRVDTVIQKKGADQVAALASPNATVEELYLLQKLMRGLGSHHIDYRFRERDFSDQQVMPAFPSQGVSIAEIENLNAILLVGSNIRFEQPMLAHRVRKAVAENADVFAINPVDYSFTFDMKAKMISADMIHALAEVAKALAKMSDEKVDAFSSVRPSNAAKEIAEQLKSAEKAGIFLGAPALSHPAAAEIRTLARIIGDLSGASIHIFTEGANASGAYLAGAIPHRGAAGTAVDQVGRDAKALLTTDPADAYFLLGIEPELDTAYPAAALKALESANLVVCMTPFVTETMKTYADVILPISPFTETSGTFVNAEGMWQSFDAITVPQGESKPAWKVLRAIARKCALEDFDYKMTSHICEELKSQVDSMPPYQAEKAVLESLSEKSSDLIRLASHPMYCVDGIVRRAKALQDTMQDDYANISVNENMAEQLGVALGDRVTAVQGDSCVTLPLMIDNRLADGVVFIPLGLEETKGFGEAMVSIKLEKGSA